MRAFAGELGRLVAVFGFSLWTFLTVWLGGSGGGLTRTESNNSKTRLLLTGELRNYANAMTDFFAVNKKMARAYTGYATLFTLLPNIVTTLVLYYGGKLVLVGDLRAGQLISFMLYQQSLSSSFQTIG